MTDQIFVQSRGASPELGYTWQPRKPERLSEFVQYTQLEDFSILLKRNQDKLYLLITGLESPQKRDFRGRTIGHSIFWIFDSSPEAEQKVRELVVQALEAPDTLAGVVDQALVFDSETGFKICQDLGKLSLEIQLAGKPLPGDGRHYKIARNGEAMRQALAQELQQSPLPREDGWLLIVTDLKAEATLRSAEPWRGLSSLVKAEEWQTVKKTTHPTPTVVTVTLVTIALILLLLILIGMALAPRPTNSDSQGGRLPDSIDTAGADKGAEIEAVNPMDLNPVDGDFLGDSVEFNPVNSAADL